MPYDLWIFYDDQGFLLHYTGLAEFQPIYRICPTFGAEGNIGIGLDMYLQSPENKAPLESLTNIQALGPSALLPIDKAAGLSVEDFYKLFGQNSKPVCFETPRDIWP